MLARVLSTAAGRETDSLINAGQAKDPTVTLIWFDNPRIIPIPDVAAGLRHVTKDQIDVWRAKAVGTQPSGR